MSHGQLHAVVRHLRRIVGEGATQATDRELLQRFVAERDENAFAALVERHGSMVWGVCRRALRHTQDAEDAFQATFLVLARKAGAVHWRESIHNWLYEVASRLAAEMRVKAARRKLHERQAAQTRSEVVPDQAGRELASMLDEELQRLPARYRAPLLLCYLEGQTSDQAARHLGWSLRTLQRRLAQGRELLRHRLTKRGLTLSAALLAPALSEGGTVPALLTIATVRSAVSFTLGTTAAVIPAAALAQQVLRGMAMTRWKIAALVLVVLGTIAGTGFLTHHSFASPAIPQPGDPEQRPQQAREAPPTGKAPAAVPETKPKSVSLADRLWAMMELVREKHPKPPARREMILSMSRLLFATAEATSPDDFEERAARVSSREQFADYLKYIGPKGKKMPADNQLEQAAIEGLFAAVPGRGAFVPPDQLKGQEAINANRYVGIGIQLRIDPDEKLPQILIPFRGGPARRAGIKANDLIVDVDGKNTRDVPLVKVVEWIRGEEGTSFTMTIRTPGETKTRTVKMTRSVVPFDTVMGYRSVSEDAWDFHIDPKTPIGYVRLETIRSSTPHELRQLERRLRSEGVKALVIDMRTSAGGTDWHNATLTASALLDGGVMWRTSGADKELRQCRAGHECLFRDWPIAVLINDYVDSVQMAVLAAWQDNGRAVLVGEPTLVGGFINTMTPLPDGQGAVLFRTGRVERAAKGRSWPVVPDHPIALTKEQRAAVDGWLQAKARVTLPGSPESRRPADPQLDKAVEVLRAALKKTEEGR